MVTRATGILLAVVVVLGAAACGGGGKKAATTTATTTTAATTTAGTTTASTSVLATLAALGNCPQLSALETSLVGALTGASGNVQQEIAAIKRAAAKTPAAVRPDFETIADALAQAATSLKGVDLSKATAATVTKLMAKLQSPEVQQATAHIRAWAKTHCHA